MPGLVLVTTRLSAFHYPPRGSGHMENQSRIERAVRGLRKAGLLNAVERVSAGPGSLKIFERVHSKEYLEWLRMEVEDALDAFFIDSDTYVSPGSLEAVAGLAGSIEVSLERVRDSHVVILARPPGHHVGVSGPGLGAPSLGGCLVNTAAAAALKLAERVGRVAIVDFDLHHGNGTQEIVEVLGGDRVIHIDVHQDYRITFPWTGGPEDSGERVLNVNLPEGSGDDIFSAVAEGVRGLLEEWRAEAVVVSAGFGAYRGDSGLTRLSVGSRGFHELGRALSRWPTISILEGGFGQGLERGLPAYIAGLLGLNDPIGDPEARSPQSVWEMFEEANRGVVEG